MPRSSKSRSKAILVKLDASLLAKVARAAKSARKNRSAFIRQALEEKIGATADAKSCGALAADLAGCVAGVADASTHPRWLAGYGA